MPKYHRKIHDKPSFQSFSEVTAYAEKHFAPVHSKLQQIERLSAHLHRLKRSTALLQSRQEHFAAIVKDGANTRQHLLSEAQKALIQDAKEKLNAVNLQIKRNKDLAARAFEQRRLLYPPKDSKAWYLDYTHKVERTFDTREPVKLKESNSLWVDKGGGIWINPNAETKDEE